MLFTFAAALEGRLVENENKAKKLIIFLELIKILFIFAAA